MLSVALAERSNGVMKPDRRNVNQSSSMLRLERDEVISSMFCVDSRCSTRHPELSSFRTWGKIECTLYVNGQIMRKRQLTKQQLLACSMKQKSDKSLVFDFSRVHKDVFYQVLEGIEKYGVINIESLVLSLDLFYKSYKSEFPSLKPDHTRRTDIAVRHVEPQILTESAYRQIPKTTDLVVDTVCKILKETTSLNSLEFRSFLFNNEQLERLAEGLREATSLNSVKFSNVPLFDDGFEIISRSIRHPGLASITFATCGLSDKAISAVKSLLSYQVSVQKEAEWKASLELDGIVSTICLKKLDLSGNVFSFGLLSSIVDILADLPMTHLDLTDNQPMEDRSVNELRKLVPHLDIRVNDGLRATMKRKRRPPTEPVPVTGPASSPRTARSTMSTSLRKTVVEGKGGRRTLASKKRRARKKSRPLKLPSTDFLFSDQYFSSQMQSANPLPSENTSTSSSEGEEIELAPGVVVVGRRAQQFADFVAELCKVAEKRKPQKRHARKK